MRVTYFVMEYSIWDMDPDARRKAGVDLFLDFDPVNPDADDQPSQHSDDAKTAFHAQHAPASERPWTPRERSDDWR